MAEIRLTQGKIAIVDDADLPLLDGRPWCAQKTRHHWYAVSRGITMHRLLAGAEGLQVDHIDGDGLNNRRSNLRVGTVSQNQANRRTAFGASRFKGVNREKRGKPWRAAIKVNGRKIHLGAFEDEAEAARAYDQAALEYFGEFACTNEMLGLL